LNLHQNIPCVSLPIDDQRLDFFPARTSTLIHPAPAQGCFRSGTSPQNARDSFRPGIQFPLPPLDQAIKLAAFHNSKAAFSAGLAFARPTLLITKYPRLQNQDHDIRAKTKLELS
jgi:hypothetical protein